MRRFMTAVLIVGAVLTLAGCAGSRAFQRGEHYAQNGDWDLAVKEYREATKNEPQNIEYRSSLLRAQETAANEHYKKAREFVKERKLDQAVVELQQALYLNPANAAIQGALRSVLDMKQAEEHYRAALTFEDLGRLNDALNELAQAVNLDPNNAKYLDAQDKLQRKKNAAEPEDALSLASTKPITLNFKNTNIKEVFELLAKLSGINILFDEDVRAQPVTIFVKDVSFQYALNLLLSTNNLFMKKVSDDTIIIIPKTKQKMDQYQDLMVKTFYLTNAKAKDMVNLLRSMLDVRKIYVNEADNSITMRDTPEKLKLAAKVIAANDLKAAEVVLDVEILEISRTKALQYGWNFSPQSLTATAFQNPSVAATATTGGVALSDISNLGKNNIFLTLPSVVVNLLKQDSDAQTLANPRVRVMDGQKAKFLIGDRIPIQTATVQSTTTAAITSSFEYKDVGIKLGIEPDIHLNNTITLKLNMEISTLGDAMDFGNGQKQYRFGTRDTDTVINLQDGETVIIGGMIKDEERKSRVKIPILGDIPVIGRLFSSTDNGTVKTDILMSITPNIVRTMELPDKDDQAFWSGTEDTYSDKPLFVSEGEQPAQRTTKRKEDKSAVLDALAKRGPQAVTAPTVTLPAPTARLSAPTGTPPAPAPQASSLTIVPAQESTGIGQDARFDVAAAGLRDLYGAIVTISYDPAVVEFKSAGEGPLLRQDGQQTSFLFSNNIKAGTVDVYLTRIGDVGGVSGKGNLFSIVFQGKAGGSSDITVKSAKLTTYKREQLRADLHGAAVRVQ